MSGFIWENLWHLVHLLLNFCKCLDASMSFGGVLIPAVNSIGSGLRLCTVGVVNIISLGLIGILYFLLRILKLTKIYLTKSLAKHKEGAAN